MRQTLYFILLGYLSGSILFANVFAKLFHKEDIAAKSKDQNPGAANAFVYGGFLCGVCTLCCDVLKGVLPIALYARHLPEAPTMVGFALVLAAPVIGHILPVFYRFRGGKGIAVTFGCLAGLLPYGLPLIVFAAVFIFLSVAVRISPHFYRTIGAYVGTLAMLLLLRAETAVCLGFLIITVAVCYRLHVSKEEREAISVKLLWMH